MGRPERFSCQEALSRLYAYLDGELSSEEEDSLQAHIDRCKRCYGRVEVERRIQERIREQVHGEKAPQTLLDRVSKILEGL